MDTLAAEAGERNETLLFAIARMEEKLEQSRKTVETAARAGELAAAAAGTTGDRLMESVKMALDGARDASSQIQNQTFEASESAARALAEHRPSARPAAPAHPCARLAVCRCGRRRRRVRLFECAGGGGVARLLVRPARGHRQGARWGEATGWGRR